MRIVFVGASQTAVNAARRLGESGHEVVMIDESRERLTAIEGELDVALLHGDGSKPGLLREADPEHSDVLVAMSDSDQDNIIASVVARSLGFGTVVTKIEDESLEPICREIGLDAVIVPARANARRLAALIEGRDDEALSGMIRGDVRLFAFSVEKPDAGPISGLGLPEGSRAVVVYRGEETIVVDDDGLELRPGDEVVILARARHLETLERKWAHGAHSGRPLSGLE